MFGSGFSSANSKPTSLGSGGGLFGSTNNTSNANGGSTGFSFGSGNTTNTNTQPTTNGLFGSQPSNQSGGLFGNKSVTNTTSSFGSGGLFGGNSTNNTSASSTGGGLFGSSNTNNNNNTQTSTGLFGNNNNSGPQNSNGLFGNNSASSALSANNSTTQNSAGLFGSSQNQNSNGLFNSSNNGSLAQPSGGSFFSSNSQKPAGGLFGKSNQQTSLLGNTNNSVIGTPPTKQYNFKDLPKSLTDSSKTQKTSHSSSARKRSLSNTSPNPAINTARTSILQRLSSRLGKSQTHYDSEGLFSPKKDLISLVLSSEKPADQLSSNKRNFSPVSSFKYSSRTSSSTTNEYLKLKVDPSRTEARRVKIFGDSERAQKVRILGRESDIQTSTESSSYENSNNKDHDEEPSQNSPLQDDELLNNETKKSEEVKQQEQEYWCSPSIEELSKLPLRQLYEIPYFTIGRKGYGTISFDLPVDLTAFWSDLAGNLFDKTIKFNRNKTVEVYPEGSVPLGTGLNVPATITIENVFPVSKDKKNLSDQSTKDVNLRLFLKKLKEQKGMEFVTYDPINGSWTFKVKHFSIWGLVEDEEEAEPQPYDTYPASEEVLKDASKPAQPIQKLKPEVSVYSKSNFQKSYKPRNSIEDTFVFKRQRTDENFDNSISMPGSFIIEDPRDLESPDTPDVENILSEDENDGLPLFSDIGIPSALNHDDSLNSESEFSDEPEEKQFEPTNLDVVDFFPLEVDPKLAVSDSWEDQLKISARFDSAYGYNANAKQDKLTSSQLDSLLFGDFSQFIKNLKRVKKELRLTSYNLSRFSNGENVSLRSVDTASSVTFVTPLKSQKSSTSLIASIYRKHLHNSKVVTRENKFPKVSPNSKLSFNFLAQTVQDSSKVVWSLASTLFDSKLIEDDVQNPAVYNRVIEKKRTEGLQSWLKSDVQVFVDERIDSLDDVFEQIFLLLVSFNIPNAAKLAIKSNNPHLAVLISLLDSNDPDVKYSATKQLEDWKKQAVLQTIPDGLLKIYYLLKGDILNSKVVTGLTWEAKLLLLISYGDTNNSLANLLLTFIDSLFEEPHDQITFNLLKLYVHKHTGKYQLDQILSSLRSKFDVSTQWYVYEILIRSTNQLSFGESNEVGDRLTSSFFDQLVANELYEEATFVISHLNNDHQALKTFSEFLSINLDKFSKIDGLLERITTDLHVPVTLVLQAKALYFRYTGDIWKEADALLLAGDFVEAHKTIINKVAPAAVINDGPKLEQLKGLISRFPEQHYIKDWAIGLAVYKNYIQFSSSNTDNSLTYLVNNIPLVKQTNFKIKVAVKLISKKISKRLLNLSKTDEISHLELNPQKILNLPLGEDKAYFSKLLLLSFIKQETKDLSDKNLS